MRAVFLSVLVLLTTPVVVPNKLYTPKEQRALKKFHSMVDFELPHAYMHEDSYLINWIRSATGNNNSESELNVERFQNLTKSFYKISSELDLNKAKKNLEATLKWRKDENVDNVLNEDFSDIWARYPFKVATGQNGAVVLTFDYATWNFVEATMEDPASVRRYFYYILETVSTKARDNKSNISILIDARTFNPVIHACEKCLNIYDVFYSTLNAHYPQILNRFVVINAPVEKYTAVDNVFDKSLTKNEMKRKKIYGDNEEEYLQDLDSFIPLKNIPQHFVKPVPTEAPKPVIIPDWLSLWKTCAGCSLG